LAFLTRGKKGSLGKIDSLLLQKKKGRGTGSPGLESRGEEGKSTLVGFKGKGKKGKGLSPLIKPWPNFNRRGGRGGSL